MVSETLLLMKTSHRLQPSRLSPCTARSNKTYVSHPNGLSTPQLYSPAVPISGPRAATAPPLRDLSSAEVSSAGRGWVEELAAGCRASSALWQSKGRQETLWAPKIVFFFIC